MVYYGQAKNRFQLELPERVVHKVDGSYELQSQKKGAKRYWTNTTRVRRRSGAEGGGRCGGRGKGGGRGMLHLAPSLLRHKTRFFFMYLISAMVYEMLAIGVVNFPLFSKLYVVL